MGQENCQEEAGLFLICAFDKTQSLFQRDNLNDFERFKVFKAKQHRNRLIRVEMGKLKKTAKAKPAAAPKASKQTKAKK